MKTNLINTIKVQKSNIFDGLEIKSATFLDKCFPTHFHTDWSLTFIEKGSENIAFKDFEFLMHSSAVVLIPPNSIHKNWGNKKSIWTYRSLYINEDVVKYICKKQKLDYTQILELPYYIKYINSPINVSQKSLAQLIKTLLLENISSGILKKTVEHKSSYFNEVLTHLVDNYNKKIKLDDLEKQFCANKFKIQKQFKKFIGITPLEYQTTMRIENSKRLFFEDISISQIALEVGFYDQSHFSHYFKKYVGVSPGIYKVNSKILQD